MKKISYIFPNFFFIGAQRAAAACIRVLHQRNLAISVIVINPQGEMKNELPHDINLIQFENNSFISKIPFFRIFIWPFELRKILAKEKPDTLVSICPQTNFTLVLYRLIFGKDIIFVAEEHQHLSNAIHNDPKDFKKPWKYLYYFSLKNYRRLDLLRCVSKAAADDFVKNWNVPAHIVCPIYPAFDLERIRQRGNSSFPINKTPTICSVGRLTSQKDFALLIQAFRHVKQAIPAKLIIAGTGPERENLLSLITQLNLKEDVQLLGFVECAEQVIASSDLFVMTSVWEGFPATIVEAMVLGTTVVSVNCESGPAELIDDGVNGILVDSREPDIIAQAIIKLVRNPELCKRLAHSAKNSINKYSLETTVTEFQSALERLH